MPSINVSGRLYPVQIRYRPVQDEEENDDRTLMQAIADACDELMGAGSGDILVFLPANVKLEKQPKPCLRLQERALKSFRSFPA